MPSNHLILCCPFSSCLQSFPTSGSFQMSQLFVSSGQSIGVSTSVLPMNTQDWFPLGWTSWISLQSKGLSKESSPIPQLKSINSSALSPLYSPTLTLIHDYWKNHSFDWMDLCQQSNVSCFSMLSRLVITFLPRSNYFNVMAGSLSAVIVESTTKKVSHCFHVGVYYINKMIFHFYIIILLNYSNLFLKWLDWVWNYLLTTCLLSTHITHKCEISWNYMTGM